MNLFNEHRLIIFSGGIKNIIEFYFKNHSNKKINLIANEIFIDKPKFFNKKNIIVATNKNEEYLKRCHIELYKEIKDKPIIILGDNIHDTEIFLNKNNAIRILLCSKKEDLSNYRSIDFLIENKDDLNGVLKLIKRLLY